MSEEPHLPKPEETRTRPLPRQYTPEEVEAIIDAQGVRKTATIEHQLGMGDSLFESDEEFEEFMKVIEATRKQKD